MKKMQQGRFVVSGAPGADVSDAMDPMSLFGEAVTRQANGYCPMLLYYKTWGERPFARILTLAHVNDLFFEAITDARPGALVWGVSGRLVARDCNTGKLIVGVQAIQRYLRDNGYMGFREVSHDSLVCWEYGCPACGERRADELVWFDREWVQCQTCACEYRP